MKKGLYLLSFFLIVLGAFADSSEAHFIWEKIPVFNCIFGFLGTVCLIFGAKFLKHFVQRDENYYD